MNLNEYLQTALKRELDEKQGVPIDDILYRLEEGQAPVRVRETGDDARPLALEVDGLCVPLSIAAAQALETALSQLVIDYWIVKYGVGS